VKPPSRQRIDLLLVERGLAPTRAKAQALVMAGVVSSGGRRIDKVGTLLERDADLHLASDASRFVSRGGDKLDHALATFAATGLDVAGAVALDVGAGTGGFTDCLLTRGVSKVYAVDVGYGQLAERLRTDARVIVRERTNARELTPQDFADVIDLVVVDASFIGLGKLAPAIFGVLRPEGALVALIKPQFEAGRSVASRGHGVIRDPQARDAAVEKARDDIVGSGFRVVAEVDSAVPGRRGNVERFVYARRATELPSNPQIS
jgi:23S rRNA (cytidine1920-2'-O)/16S rRNA (cytidine1409-2'-O)-methyltransferase